MGPFSSYALVEPRTSRIIRITRRSYFFAAFLGPLYLCSMWLGTWALLKSTFCTGMLALALLGVLAHVHLAGSMNVVALALGVPSILTLHSLATVAIVREACIRRRWLVKHLDLVSQ